MSRASKKKSAASKKSSASSALTQLALAALVLGGLAWAVTNVAFGERTLWEHGRTLVGAKVSATPNEPTVTDAVRRELDERVAQADRAPAEELTQEDRDALDALIPH